MPKENTHPQLHNATVECACGHSIQTRLAAHSFKLDICAACHPFFTGKQKLVDKEGRVQRFNRKYQRS